MAPSPCSIYEIAACKLYFQNLLFQTIKQIKGTTILVITQNNFKHTKVLSNKQWEAVDSEIIVRKTTSEVTIFFERELISQKYFCHKNILNNL